MPDFKGMEVGFGPPPSEPKEPEQAPPKNYLRDFLIAAVISLALTFIFRWNARELVLGFWTAGFWLGLLFCIFAFYSVVKGVERPDKSVSFVLVMFLFIFLAFEGYTSDLINKAGIEPALGGDTGSDIISLTKEFLPFIAFVVYYEIKNIFFADLETWQELVKFLIIFVRLQLLAWFCFYVGRDIPLIVLYVVVYTICFFPIRIFEDDGAEEV